MKKSKALFLTILLVSVLALLVACNQPVGPNNDTTAPDQITTEPPASLGNPIKEVVKTSDGKIGILYEDNSTMTFENIPLTNDRNSVIVTEFSLDEEKRELKITLADSAAQNMANIILKTGPEAVTFRLREKDGNLEWTNDKESNWQTLCPATDANALVKLAELNQIGKIPAMSDEKNMIFVISGNTVRIRAKDWLREGYDLCYDGELHETDANANGNFDLGEINEISSSLAATSTLKTNRKLFKSVTDNIPPFNFNGSYIGARHGYYCLSELKNTFALTEKDIGVVFTRKNDNQKFVLVRATATTVWFCPFDDAAMNNGNFSKYTNSNTLLKANQVLSAEGRSDITILANATQQQLRTCTNHAVQRAFLNGVKEVDLTKSGCYTADFIDVYEEYDLLYLPAILNYLMENKGNNTNESCHDESIEEAYIHFAYTHRFNRNGSYTVYQTNTIEKKISNVTYYGLQSMAFQVSEQYAYVPGSNNLSTPVLQKSEVINPMGLGTKVYNYYQMTDLKGTMAVCVGYYPEYGIANSLMRGTMFTGANKLGFYHSSRKLYPMLLDKKTMNPNDVVSFIGYHVPTIPVDNDFFAVNWAFVGDEVMLSLNADKAIAEKTVKLPEYLNGMNVTVVTSSNFNVASSTIDNGIKVSTTGAGWVTVKLTPAK